MQEIHCAIITIGDELLIGQTIDTNSAWMARQLNDIGILVKRRVAVGDHKASILRALDEEKQYAEVILITGGLGPTADDITKPLLCDYFGGQLVQNDQVMEMVKAHFTRRNRPMPDSNLLQAMVPNVCEVLYNEFGTAPGMLFREGKKIFVSMPGVPLEMQYIMKTYVLPLLQKNFDTPNIIHRTLITSGEGESAVSARLNHFESTLPDAIKLAYLPSLNMVKLRLTGIDIANKTVDDCFHQLKETLSDIIVADEDIEFEEAIGKLLIAEGKTVSTAESCTGGLFASRICSVSGASNYFKGGIVSYSEWSKIKHLNVAAQTIKDFTAVSQQTAEEMAIHCREKFETDFAVAITGYIEKGDHENEVWIALSSAKKTIAKKIIVPYERKKNAELASNTAFNLLRVFILEHHA